MHTRLNTDAMPKGRTVMQFRFSGTPADLRQFWLINDGGAVDMCLKHPGFDVDLEVQADIRRFVEAWRGFRDMKQEIARGEIRLTGPDALRRAFPRWLQLSALAPYDRSQRGRERRLAQGAGDAA